MSQDKASLKLKPPIIEQDQNKYQSEKSKTLVLILTGVIICLVVVILLIVVLPSSTEHLKLSEQHNNEDKIVNNERDDVSGNQTIEKKSEQLTSAVSETDSDEKKANKKVFDQAIELDWMLKKSDAENSKLNIWSEENYLSAIETADKAELFKNNEQFEDAVKHYKKAIMIVDAELKTKNEKFNLFLSSAIKALEEEQIIEAGEWFKKAQAIEAENKAVLKGLYQIERREEVNQKYNLVLKFEQENELEKALTLLDKILTIDPDYKKAVQKQNSVKQKILANEFKQLISQVLILIEKKQYYDARVALKQAENINSADEIIAELDKVIAEKIQLLTIKQLKRQADAQEKHEQWKKALKLYLSIKKYDTDISGIEIDIRRVSAYIKFNDILDKIILNPQRLNDNSVFEQLKKSLLHIDSELSKNDYLLFPLEKTPDIAKKLLTAKKIMEDAGKIIIVTINSDKQTDIVIYKIGKLGKLDNKTLYLRSGNYTIVGSRKGYRDYRRKINIMPSQQRINIEVICSEKI